MRSALLGGRGRAENCQQMPHYPITSFLFQNYLLRKEETCDHSPESSAARRDVALTSGECGGHAKVASEAIIN